MSDSTTTTTTTETKTILTEEDWKVKRFDAAVAILVARAAHKDTPENAYDSLLEKLVLAFKKNGFGPK
jgi:hypothetical protein